VGRAVIVDVAVTVAVAVAEAVAEAVGEALGEGLRLVVATSHPEAIAAARSRQAISLVPASMRMRNLHPKPTTPRGLRLADC
jgi:hypothetical protein